MVWKIVGQWCFSSGESQKVIEHWCFNNEENCERLLTVVFQQWEGLPLLEVGLSFLSRPVL
jgi:hypothetical protein